jgi:hypothetical protein
MFFISTMINLKYSSKNIYIFYVRNLTVFFLYILEEFDNLEKHFKVDHLIESHTVYYLHLTNRQNKNNNKIIIKCLSKIFINVEELYTFHQEFFLSNTEVTSNNEKKTKTEHQKIFKENQIIACNLLKFLQFQLNTILPF